MKLFTAFTLIIFSSFKLSAQHMVTLRSGEKLHGEVISVQNGVLELSYKGNMMKLKLNEIYSINFAESEAAKAGSGMDSKAAEVREVGEKQVTAGSYNVRYKVADRVITKAPRIDNLTQDKGTVVVNITIDKYGHVKTAVPGAPGTSTQNEYLHTKAKQAAESALFNNVPTAPLEQKGYMIIVF
ncbi:MAG: hypothetical protein DWQ44_09940 [Bacteroidetes bacterium]|nr:MAG: hypothetical protein DWQ33_10215 [Bacteroidota bacterium]REK06601.1 MAG: hypothetical protein DWQ39_03730 [Bacteroidota bacterium]REK33367.1 MAG: hypothetical protein DWQ44_09940 [Bacteroidota bacterium]REK49766.1 MAG: hypothetical protein DWQ48_06495 [Bacteroidota bacterium]